MALPENNHGTKKRRFIRYAVEGMAMHARMLFSEEVLLNDISVTGACIHTMKDLRIDGRFLINIPDGKTSRYLRCRTVWKARDEQVRQGYRAGLQFQDIASDEVVRLKDFMRNAGLPDEKTAGNDYQPAALRFTVVSDQKATLKIPKIFPIKKISLGGMLVESDSELRVEERYLLKIPLLQEALPLACRARIASIMRFTGIGGPRYNIGIEFLSMPEADRARLGNFIHSRVIKA